MKRTLISLFVCITVIPVIGQTSYVTSCEIRNGTAYGYVNNHADGFEINGYVWFTFFDSTGRMVAKEDEFEYEYVSSKSTEEIEYTSAPHQACRCSFDVSTATTAQTTAQTTDSVAPANSELSYSTTCAIRNGTAYGTVHNYGDGFSVSGDLWFYFYDSTGVLIDSEDEFEFEYISSDSTEEVEYTSAPSGACRCSFVIRGAVSD